MFNCLTLGREWVNVASFVSAGHVDSGSTNSAQIQAAGLERRRKRPSDVLKTIPLSTL